MAIKTTFLVFAGILTAWVGAWTLQLALAARFVIFTHEWVVFLYWFTAKVIVWILPSLLLIKQSGRSLREAFMITSWEKTLGWGFGIGMVLLVFSVGDRLINGTSLQLEIYTFSFLATVIIAPVFEELFVRIGDGTREIHTCRNNRPFVE